MTQPMDDANQWLMGGGGKGIKSAKWGSDKSEDGEKINGTIEAGELVEDPKMVDQYKYDEKTGTISNELDTWSDGTVKKQLKIVIQTSHRDNEDDDGQRAIYVRGGDLKTKIVEAIVAAGAGKEGLKKGGKLAVKFLYKRRVDGKYLTFWHARYIAPAKVEVDEWMGTNVQAAPVQQVPVHHGQPQAQPEWSQPVPQQAPPAPTYQNDGAYGNPQVRGGTFAAEDVPYQGQNTGQMSALEAASLRAQASNAALNEQVAQMPTPAHVNQAEHNEFGF